MRAVRLFVDAPLQVHSDFALPEAARHHAARVLRLKPGDRVVLFNGDGNQYPGLLCGTGLHAEAVRIATVEAPQRESPLRLTLVQALARGEKMDWIVQKATELGVARIIPVATERSEVRLGAERGASRRAHWQAIVVAACEQCGRNRLPEVMDPRPLAAVLESAGTADTKVEGRWMLRPGSAVRIRDLLPGPAAIQLAVGPEGGFGPVDVESLRAAGYRDLAMGPRVLRTETAGIAALASFQALYGDA